MEWSGIMAGSLHFMSLNTQTRRIDSDWLICEFQSTLNVFDLMELDD